jgi:hypothetical protein
MQHNALQLNIWKQITNHLEELQGEFPNVDMKHEHTHHEPDLSVIQLAGVRFLQASQPAGGSKKSPSSTVVNNQVNQVSARRLG